jgi:hypothetical protein
MLPIRAADRRVTIEKEGEPMRGPWVFKVVVCLALVASSLTAWGDPPGENVDPQWSFHQTDPGPASALWHRADLSPEEQAYVDNAAIQPNDEAINTAYASAMVEQAAHAAEVAAADALGIDGLGTEGVVP